MVYTISIRDKNTGKCVVVTVHADNHPNAVVAAMKAARKRLTPPTHLVFDKDIKDEG